MLGETLRESLEAEVEHLRYRRAVVERKIALVRRVLQFDAESRAIPRERAIVLWVPPESHP